MNLPDDLIEVSTSGCRVGDRETDSLLRVNDEDCANLIQAIRGWCASDEKIIAR